MASLHPELHSIHPHRVLPPAFASALPALESSEDARGYVLLKRASLEPGEFERPEVSTVEVMGLWGSTILFATHLSPLQDFLVGEGSKLERVDYEVAMTGLGARTFKLVEMRGGAPHVNVPQGAHAQLKHGDRCPGCGKGNVYGQKEPKTLVRIVGQAPLAATVYSLERLRCGACGQVYTAQEPEGVGPEKYDETAAAMIAQLKYGS